MEKAGIEIISTGYKNLDEMLGGGIVKGSTNLVIEEQDCLGEIFLISLLENRMKYGDAGLIDCITYHPTELKELCTKYNINLYRYQTVLYLINLSSREKIKNAFGTDDLLDFAPRYVNTVSKLLSKVKIFNVVLSLSAFSSMYGESSVYNHLARELKTYESYKRTAFYLVDKTKHTEEYINSLKAICGTVIVLKKSGTYGKVVDIEKSLLPNYFSHPIPYYTRERMR